MNTEQLLLFAISLVAILSLFGVSLLLGLGGDPKIANEKALIKAADEAVSGFAPVEYAISRDGKSALAQDATGRILLLKLHGNKFAGRILAQLAKASLLDAGLEVDTGEARYGSVALAIDDPAVWSGKINNIRAAR